MIQDIAPHSFDNRYFNHTPRPGDTLLCFNGERVLLKQTASGISFPLLCELPSPPQKPIFLFTVSEQRFFLYPPDCPPPDISDFSWHETGSFRGDKPRQLAFAGITGAQLFRWYQSHRLCGACGSPHVHSETERALLCPSCGKLLYPQLSPALIIGIIDGERLLLVRYANRAYKRWALVAGYVEIGETVEQALKREVMEEVGIEVRNFRYYKSQPWSFSDSLLLGFFCDAVDSAARADGEELSEAVWFSRDQLPPTDSDISLTSEMIEFFRRGMA